MKIVSVEVEKVAVPGRTPPFTWRAGLPGSDPDHIGGVLRINTDEGIEGTARSPRGVILEDLVNPTGTRRLWSSWTEEYLDVADQCLELGYRAIKLHAWGDARRDADLAQALRAHVGDETDLMYDGSAGFDLADAVYLGRALAEAGYRWYEEPVREFSITSYK